MRRVWVSAGWLCGGCVGGLPPACFSDEECPPRSTCVAATCLPTDAVGAGGEAGVAEIGTAEAGPIDARSEGDRPPDLPEADAVHPDARSADALREDASPDSGPEDPEACNGRDDDGDGEIDEGNHLGEPCLVGVGACVRAGQYVCRDGLAACDAVPGEPEVERCDGVDNDCDAAIDEVEEDRLCYPEAAFPATLGVGLCVAGVEICGPIGTEPTCRDAVVPARERCDGLDNDCDGLTDEDFGIGNRCHVLHGDCALPGRIACDLAAMEAICVEDPPPAEICNLIDDDCDGFVDEDIHEACYEGPPGTEGVGVCRGGTRTCKDGQLLACLGQVLPGVEVPDNGLDDDCDQTTDEL